VKKVLIIFGTRPEAIKLAPVIKELEKHPESFTPVVCVTAQHRQMLDQVLALFKIRPHYDLNIMHHNQSLYDITARGLLALKDVMQKEKPDVTLVQGDTTTAFVGSLAAFYEKIPVGHVEAGLRTYNKHQPFPEEINRRLTTQIADLHFAPSQRARENLLRDGVDEKTIFVTGNTVIDALLHVVKKQSLPEVQLQWERHYREQYGIDFSSGARIVLVTGHRRENFGEGLEHICSALREIALLYPEVEVIYPVHMNPNVQEPVNRILSNVEGIHLLPPQDYEPFVYLMTKAYLILTDSGGIQEEAPSLGKPVLVMRESTERPEGVDVGTALLVGTNKERIASSIKELLTNNESYDKMSRTINPFGDGNASQLIVSLLKRTGQRL
jgi:UDP-N-acetylglucosamine 2-epimerase (non-hydrolysing)